MQLQPLLQDVEGVRLLQTSVDPKSQKKVKNSLDILCLGIPLGEREGLCELASRNSLL